MAEVEWNKALKFARDYYRSHSDAEETEALEAAGDQYGIDHHGVEGWSLGMHAGVSYLNMGDTYEVTLVAVTRARNEVKFYLTSIGDLLEKNPKLGDTQ